MGKETINGETVVDRMPAAYLADEADSIPSRRISAASDDSFDASSYVHVDSKLDSKMPKCLLSEDAPEKSIENHFAKSKPESERHNVTKNGKKIIRKRLSVSEFNASFLRAKNNVNNNSSRTSTDLSASSSSDNDTLPKAKKQGTDVLSAKIQHLLFEMKRIRQVDRDILRQFLIVNDTIEELRWMAEEKQEAIRRSLSEEGEDPVDVNFDLVPEILEEHEDDEESIQSVLSRQNSNMEDIFNDETLPADDTPVMTESAKHVSKDSDLVSTSSGDSALSMSVASSTLSSRTSLPVSNRSSSPPTSNLSTASSASSYIGSMKKKTQASEMICTARTEPTLPSEPDYEDDIEAYYRMPGTAMKRGPYPYPYSSQAHSFDGWRSKDRPHDDNALDCAYSTRRGSTDSDSREAADYAMAVRRSIVNRSYSGAFRSDNDVYQKSFARAHSTSNGFTDDMNRVKRISVRPDGTREPTSGLTPARRTASACDRTSAAFKRFQHPAHQRRAPRMTITRQLAHMSFVPIAEQEPDLMYENGRLYSNDSDSSSKFDSEPRDYENLIDLSRQRQVRNSNITRQCPPVGGKPSAAGSAGSLTSSSSATSSSSNSSLHSPTKFTINEADRYISRPTKEPVWVPRSRHSSVQTSEYIEVPHNKFFPAPYTRKYYNSRKNQGVHNLPDPVLDKKSHPRLIKRVSMPAIAYRHKAESNVLTVSHKPANGGSNEAVYKWIQTQDDVTYL